MRRRPAVAPGALPKSVVVRGFVSSSSFLCVRVAMGRSAQAQQRCSLKESGAEKERGGMRMEGEEAQEQRPGKRQGEGAAGRKERGP